MLTLSYQFSSSPAASASSAHSARADTLLPGGAGGEAPPEAIVFGAGFPGHIAIETPVLAPAAPAGAALFEIWRTGGAVARGRRGALQYWHDEHLLFGSIALAEATVSATHSAAHFPTALQAATDAAYRQIFELLDACGLPHLWRVWNFIPRINTCTGCDADDGADGEGLERYRQFNIARQAAFCDAGRALEGDVPAASAVGSAGGELAIYFFAGRTAPRPIENPRQLSAYRYPSEYGPRSPLFARAGLVPLDAGELLFISGTASIVGHRSLHIGDIVAQTRESLANIDAILDAANAQASRRRFARADLAYRIYVRRAADLEPVRTAFEAWLGATGSVIYLQADICRAELLVEIEASGGHCIEAP